MPEPADTVDFFRPRLAEMIDLRHPLAVLASRLPWTQIEATEDTGGSPKQAVVELGCGQSGHPDDRSGQVQEPDRSAATLAQAQASRACHREGPVLAQGADGRCAASGAVRSALQLPVPAACHGAHGPQRLYLRLIGLLAVLAMALESAAARPQMRAAGITSAADGISQGRLFRNSLNMLLIINFRKATVRLRFIRSAYGHPGMRGWVRKKNIFPLQASGVEDYFFLSQQQMNLDIFQILGNFSSNQLVFGVDINSSAAF